MRTKPRANEKCRRLKVECCRLPERADLKPSTCNLQLATFNLQWLLPEVFSSHTLTLSRSGTPTLSPTLLGGWKNKAKAMAASEATPRGTRNMPRKLVAPL